MTTPYLTLADFTTRTVMPSTEVNTLAAIAPGFIEARILRVSSEIDARLRKRYAAPFATPVPEAVLGWVTDIVTEAAMRRRGLDANDPQGAEYIEDAKRARAELLEAANSETGLFDLPLRDDTTETGITKGGPLGYSEQSPYVGFSVQAESARSEDAAGRGTGG